MSAQGKGTERPVMIVGYGRFGRALAGLAVEQGMVVWAMDPLEAVPSSRQPPPDAWERAGLVVMAVPMLRFQNALEEWRPHLTPKHLVIDVSSVRAGPERSMRSVLGSEVPWVGSHPLFGPTSVALGHPLRVVVCPNEVHPEAAVRVRDFYARLGCEVHLESPEEHDRRMAYSHALAFFVAKALLDMGAPSDSAVVPPSFEALAHVVQSVRSDAGHLFLAIQGLNPFAAEARQDLLNALDRLHSELADLDPAVLAETDLGTAETFRIPDLGSKAPALRETRDLIDQVDRELLATIARRIQLAKRAGEIKKSGGEGVRDPQRERDLLEERRAWAEEVGLDPAGVQRVFEGLMGLARRAQESS